LDAPAGEKRAATNQEEQRRLEAVAAEVARRRELRDKAQQKIPPKR
jgi:hypothetical protein